MKKSILLIPILFLVAVSCNSQTAEPQTNTQVNNQEVQEKIYIQQSKLEFKVEGSSAPAPVNQSHIEAVQIVPLADGSTGLQITLNEEGKQLFAELTSKNIGKQMSLYIDDVVISAPTIQSPIDNGEIVVSGGFDIEQAVNFQEKLQGFKYKNNAIKN